MDDAEKMVERVSRAIMNESRNHLGAWPPKDVADLLARAALEAAGVERLREALKFYATAWGGHPGDSGLGGSWPADPEGWPSEALLNDFGAIARTALSPSKPEDT